VTKRDGHRILWIGTVLICSAVSAYPQIEAGISLPPPSDNEVQIGLQVFSRILAPGEMIRGHIRLEFSKTPVPKDWKLIVAVLPADKAGGASEMIQNWAIHDASTPGPGQTLGGLADEEKIALAGSPAVQNFGLGTRITKRAPTKPGDYVIYVFVGRPSLPGYEFEAAAWTRLTVTDKPKRITVQESEFSPNPPEKDKVSVLKLDFAVNGIPAGAANPGDTTLEVFLERFDDPTEKTKNPYRIGLKIFRDLANQGGVARGTCNVRITPRMAKRYRLRYKVACDGYEPAEGVFTYAVKGPPGGPPLPVAAKRFEWVRVDPPRVEYVAWDTTTPGVKETGSETAMALQVRDPQGNLTTDSAVRWPEPPAVIREGQRVRLQVFKDRHKGTPVGGKWYILCDHQDWQGESFLATQEGKDSVTFSATLRCPSAGDPPKDPVEMFRAEGGVWNSSTAVNVYWKYQARPTSGDPGGTLTPDELRDLDPPQSADISGGGTAGTGGTGGTVGTGPGGKIDFTVPPAKSPDGRAKPFPNTLFGGLWKSTWGADWGDIRLKQEGNLVTGTWGGTEAEPAGFLKGRVVGRTVLLNWTNRDGTQSGGAMFTLSEDGKTMKGHRNDWREPEFAQFRWEAERVIK